jgi:saposin
MHGLQPLFVLLHAKLIILILLLFSVYLDLHTIEVEDFGPIYKDEITLSKIPAHPSRGSPLCSACEDFANKAVSYLSSKQTQDKIVEILHDACSQAFSLEQKVILSNVVFRDI